MLDGPLTVPAALDGDRVDRAISFLTGWPAPRCRISSSGAVLVDGRAVVEELPIARGQRGRSARGAAARVRLPARTRARGRHRRALRRRRCGRRRQTGRTRRTSGRGSRERHARQWTSRAVPGDRGGWRPIAARDRAPPRSRHERACSRSRARRGPTTHSSRNLAPDPSNASTRRSCGAAPRHRAE